MMTMTGPTASPTSPSIRSVTLDGTSVTVSGDVVTDLGTYGIDVFVNASCDELEHGEGELFVGSVDTSTLSVGDFSVTFDATGGRAVRHRHGVRP